MKKSVLIIKLGHCETLVNEQGFTPSLGDVFRHTVLLHHYHNYDVTWLTSEAAIPLLRDTPRIKELLIYHEKIHKELENRHFDEILCLEKASPLCRLADSIPHHQRFGFGNKGNSIHPHPGAESAMAIANGHHHFLPIQALLFEMVNDYWQGQDYVLDYKPRPLPKFDVGLNYLVGSKWPNKVWPMRRWKELDRTLKQQGISTSWQEGARDLQAYMDWIAAAKVIVTCDSLGMHLGLAMQKQVIALFGPTPSEQIHMYGRGIILSAEWACPHIPCMNPECLQERDKANPASQPCMDNIMPSNVKRHVLNVLATIDRKATPPPSIQTATHHRKARRAI